MLSAYLRAYLILGIYMNRSCSSQRSKTQYKLQYKNDIKVLGKREKKKEKQIERYGGKTNSNDNATY